jgi:hypothetical protein
MRTRSPRFGFASTVENKEKPEIVLLITWFERYCDVRYDVFSEEYGGGGDDALSVFHDFLETLLERVVAWAAVENLSDIEQKAKLALSDLQKALQSIPK